MFFVTREVEFCYGHRLLRYNGKCRHLHGHNARVVLTLEGDRLDGRGMLVDFGDVKRVLQGWVDENLDHNMLLCRDDPILPVLQVHGERIFAMDDNPTAENIAELIYDRMIDAGLPVRDVVVWETPSCYAGCSKPRPPGVPRADESL